MNLNTKKAFYNHALGLGILALFFFVSIFNLALNNKVLALSKKDAVSGVKQFCENKVSDKAKEACDDVAKTAFDFAYTTENCKSKEGSERNECSRDLAKSYIQEALQGSPASAKELKNAVKAVLSNEKDKAAYVGAGSVGDYQCGNYPDDSRNVKTKINFGCLGSKGPANLSPIKDFAYAIIRFLSVGVGIALVLSIILAGLQYSASEGNPEATMKAKKRIISVMIGLAIYIFAFSIMQYLVPGGLFNPGFWLFSPVELFL